MLKEIKEFLSEYEDVNVEGLTFIKRCYLPPFASKIFVCDSPNLEFFGATFTPYRTCGAIIVLSRDIYGDLPQLVETCSHECFHTVYRLLGKTYDSPISENSEEIYAHFIGSLTRKVFEIVTNSKNFCEARKIKKKKLSRR
jgi:hypothetical protein